MKSNGTLRERKPLGEFLHLLEHNIVFNWSYDRNPLCTNYKLKQFALEPTIPKTAWDEAFE